MEGESWSVSIRDLASTFERRFRRVEVQLQMPGRHNVLNALAAAALAYENGLSAEQISAGLDSFPVCIAAGSGLACGQWRDGDRRLRPPSDGGDGRFGGVRRMFPTARVCASFSPHQASRTARLLDELAASLQNADKVLVAEIFGPARAIPNRGRSGGQSRPAGRRPWRRGVARPYCRRDRPNSGSPIGPRRRNGYARGWRCGENKWKVT